ncbi:MAG: single-stranded-DNA-specific exonuclease RecJ [Clostridia bacterium]|nr:single-stranded-DNA-specific exonuclease RecJ [Clostridia bacterium]
MQVSFNILNKGMKIPAELIEAAGGDELIARIFFNRGYRDPKNVKQMLKEELYEPTNPYEFPDMAGAVERIDKAIASGEKIAVYGDYDVDGVTSTATLVQSLRIFSDKVIYHVPDRFTEGYGMNADVIRDMGVRGVSLIITCDCGISNINEIGIAKELGMDVIVTDHHNLPEQLPPADYVLNPKLLAEGHRARNLSGCGMAYFLCSALLYSKGMENKADDLLDLLALSLVADVVSLNGENRYLLKKAIPVLFNTNRIGLKELFTIIEKTAKMQSEEDIAFQIAPRINAAGRMETARLPVELFLSGNRQESEEIALKIDFLNKERKRVQQEIINQAIAQVEDKKKNKTVLVLFNEYWHHGIIGIAAGKVCETYRKPAILLSMKEDGKTVVGSARSVESINIYELIKECSSKLIKFGGHSQAAGLSLNRDDVEAFTIEIERLAERRFFIRDTIQIDVDAELDLGEINEELNNRLISAGPYGEGFEPPFFATRNVTVVSDRKTEKNHHIMVLAGENGIRIPAVKWFGENKSLQDKKFDIAYKVGVNTYRGNSEIQLTLDSLLETEGNPVKAFSGRFIEGRGFSLAELLKKHKNSLIFFEGLRANCPVRNTVTRYNIHKTDNLILLSTPASTIILREAISLANPENVIISFLYNPDYSMKGFLVNLLGVIKYLINNESGKSNFESLSSKLCVEEGIIKAALKYLKSLGKVEYSVNLGEEALQFYMPDDNRTGIDMKTSGFDKSPKKYESNLKEALAEKSSYQQFLLKLEIEKFNEYLK